MDVFYPISFGYTSSLFDGFVRLVIVVLKDTDNNVQNDDTKMCWNATFISRFW